MPNEIPKQYPWLQFATELPTFLEFLALVGAVACIIYVGHLIKSIWDRNNETVPIPVAIVMNVAMLVAYAFLVRTFYSHATDDRKISVLVWCFIFLVPPAFYYGRIIAVSFANRVIDQISPFNMRIEEPSEFAEARKLALRGDVDGAVKRYRAYLDNTDLALFEAARLLKSQDRFAEAAALFLEISERFYGKKVVWAEATFHLAKLRESHLHQAKDAMGLLEKILERASDTRFGQLAQTELTCMQTLYIIDPNESVIYSEPDVAEEDPFYADGHVYATPVVQLSTPGDNGRRRGAEFHDTPIPPVDPFYAAAMQRARENEALEAEPIIEVEPAKPAQKKTSIKKTTTKKATAKHKPESAE